MQIALPNSTTFLRTGTSEQACHPVSRDLSQPRRLFRADCGMHDEAHTELALGIEFLDIGKEGLGGRFLDRPAKMTIGFVG